MITNERQYRITRAQALRFQRALDEFDGRARPGVDPRLIVAERDAMASQLADLRGELQEYDALKSSDRSTFPDVPFEELADALIEARIALAIPQAELAERLGVKEQQVQRYEAERYRAASYERLQDVAQALGLRIRNQVLLPIKPLNFSGLMRKLQQAGLKKRFLLSRLFPPDFSERAAAAARSGADEDALLAQAGAILGRVFGWSPVDLFGSGPLPEPRPAGAQARYKMPARRTRAATRLYAAYANHLAVSVLQSMPKLPRRPIVADAGKVRADLLERHGGLTLETALHYVWDLGVPVLPLRDSGAFHGACWRHDGQNVIVLKQTSSHEARWQFDLFHELFHAGQHSDADTMAVIEADETSSERRHSAEEIAANQFAGDVLLDGRADELARECVRRADGLVLRLKAATQAVAESAGVGVGVLAYYLAFRLSREREEINWWGAASNLQTGDAKPWDTARSVFFDRVSLTVMDDVDQQLLRRALDTDG